MSGRRKIRRENDFVPYYRRQRYDETSLVWREAPGIFPTEDEAVAAFDVRLAVRWRSLYVAPDGRTPGVEVVLGV